MEKSKNIIKKFRAFNIKYETDGLNVDLPQELFFDLSLESDEINDSDYISEALSDEISGKTGYLHNGFDFEEIVDASVEEKQKVYVVMIDDVYIEDTNIQDCTVWSLKESAISQLKKIAESYKADSCAEFLADDLVGFDIETTKEYVMTESDEHFTFYKNGYHLENHIEIWILEKELDNIA